MKENIATANVRGQAWQLKLLLLLLGLSGLGSETIYFKLMDHMIGSTPLVSYAVVAFFILGSGLGQLCSSRFLFPWKVELALFILNTCILLGHTFLLAMNASALNVMTVAIGPTAASVVMAFLYVFFPAFLLGVSLPFAVEMAKSLARSVQFYFFGTILGVLLVEACIYPFFGVLGCIVFLILSHLASFYLFFHLKPSAPFQLQCPSHLKKDLVVIGVLTGATQALFIWLIQAIFSSFYFVIPMVVLAVHIGLWLGVRVWLKCKYSYGANKTLCLLGLFVSISLMALYCYLTPSRTAINTLWISVLVTPFFVFAGSLLPSFLGEESFERKDVGSAMLSISLGNCIGIFLLGGVLSNFLSPHWCAVVISALFVVALGRKQFKYSGALFIMCVVSALFLNEESLFRQSIVDRYFYKFIEPSTVQIKSEKVFNGPGSLTAVFSIQADRKDHESQFATRRFYQNGLSSVGLQQSSIRDEAVLALAARCYSSSQKSVLLLGVASGITAGYAAQFFDHVDMMDIDPNIPKVVNYLSDVNLDAANKEKTSLLRQDAILAPYLYKKHKFDTIILALNSTLSPLTAKLYTVEAIKNLKTLLKPGGIFLSWTHSGLSPEGRQVLYNTLGSVFTKQLVIAPFIDDPNEIGDFQLILNSDEALFCDPQQINYGELAQDLVVQDFLREPVEDKVIFPRVHSTQQRHHLFKPALSLLITPK